MSEQKEGQHRQISPPTSTPLDLLLNAIQDSHHEHPFDNVTGEVDLSHDGDPIDQDHSIGSLLAASRLIGKDGKKSDAAGQLSSSTNVAQVAASSLTAPTAQPDSRKRRLSIPAHDLSRSSKMAKTLATHIMTSAVASRAASAFSTVTIIHGSTGQKSYANEKRFLLPPPLLRVTGPLLSQLTHVSLSVIPPPPGATPDFSYTDLCNASATSSTQAYLFPIQEGLEQLENGVKKSTKSKTMPALKAAATRRRDELRDGLGFPNLWAKQEDLGKAKSFWLRLAIGRLNEDPVFDADAAVVPNEMNTESARDEEAREALQTLHNNATQHSTEEHGPPDMATALAEGAYPEEHDVGIFSETLMDATSVSNSTASHNAVAGPSTYATTSAAVNQIGEPASPWATFISNPVNIVSKPSQRTAKARSIATCLTYGSSVALWVRINSQNARTKFMHIQEARQPGNADEKGEQTADGDGMAGGGGRPVLTARTAKWSAFRLDAVRRSAGHDGESAGPTTTANAVGKVVTYGSIVVLTDLITGIVSEPIRLTKVDKLLALKEDTGPVSELQKVAFGRVDQDGVPVRGEHPGDWYLSAPSAMVEVADPSKARRKKGAAVAEREGSQTGDWRDSRPEPADLQTAEEEHSPATYDDIPIIKTSFNGIPKTKGKGSAGNGKGKARGKAVLPKTKRNAIALANAAEERDVSGRTAGLSWAAGREREVMMEVSLPSPRGEGQRGKERVPSVLQKAFADQVEDCMIWTIGSVSHSSYTFFDGHGSATSLPRNPITPCPMLLEEPVLHVDAAGDRTMVVTVSHFHLDDNSAFEIFLGPLGPLRALAYRSTAPRDKDPYNAGGSRTLARCASMNGPDVDAPVVYSSYPAVLPHTVVSIDLPPVSILVTAMRDCHQDSSTYRAGFGDASATQPQLEDPYNSNLRMPSASRPPSAHWDATQTGDMVLQDALQDVGRAEAAPFAASSSDAMTLEGVFPGRTEEVFPGDADFPPANDDQPRRDTQRSASPGAAGGVLDTLNLGTELPVLSMPAEFDSTLDLAPLPLLFVRTSDGAGYALNKHLAATSVRDYSEDHNVIRDELGELWDLSVV